MGESPEGILVSARSATAAKQSSELRRDQGLGQKKRRRVAKSEADDVFTMFIYFTGQGGFGNRMMSFVSAL